LLNCAVDLADGGDMDVSGTSAATNRARAEAEASMAILDKVLDTARSGAALLLDTLPAADPSKGNRFDIYA
jgi:hypothetical protein